MTLEPDHTGGKHRILQVGEFLLDHPPLLIAQLLRQHLLGSGRRHPAEVLLFGCYVQNNGVSRLGVFRHLHHLRQGDLMVFAFHLVNNDLAGEHAITLFFEVQAYVEVAEVVLLKRVFADPDVEGSAVALVSLEQGFPQGCFHHLRRQLLFFADVVDQVGKARKKDECHRLVRVSGME